MRWHINTKPLTLCVSPLPTPLCFCNLRAHSRHSTELASHTGSSSKSVSRCDWYLAWGVAFQRQGDNGAKPNSFFTTFSHWAEHLPAQVQKKSNFYFNLLQLIFKLSPILCNVLGHAMALYRDWVAWVFKNLFLLGDHLYVHQQGCHLHNHESAFPLILVISNICLM